MKITFLHGSEDLGSSGTLEPSSTTYTLIIEDCGETAQPPAYYASQLAAGTLSDGTTTYSGAPGTEFIAGGTTLSPINNDSGPMVIRRVQASHHPESADAYLLVIECTCMG